MADKNLSADEIVQEEQERVSDVKKRETYSNNSFAYEKSVFQAALDWNLLFGANLSLFCGFELSISASASISATLAFCIDIDASLRCEYAIDHTVTTCGPLHSFCVNEARVNGLLNTLNLDCAEAKAGRAALSAQRSDITATKVAAAAQQTKLAQETVEAVGSSVETLASSSTASGQSSKSCGSNVKNFAQNLATCTQSLSQNISDLQQVATKTTLASSVTMT